VNVTFAVITVGYWVDRFTLAVAVEEEFVPASFVLLTQEAAAYCGVTQTFSTVLTGIFVALRPTVTGFVVPLGRVISGFV
jgi:hypothetical protein